MCPSDGPNPSGLCMCGCGQPAPIARMTKARYGHVKGQPVRFIHNHHSRKSGPDYLVDPESGCWVWQLSGSQGGYGQKCVGGKAMPAHRYYYEQKYGPIPEGLDACHRCDNPSCVNPDHIFPGTREENVADCIAKGRRAEQRGRWRNQHTAKRAEVAA